MTRRDTPDLGKLIEWVLNIAETRHRAWVNGEPDPYGLPVPESIAQITNPGTRSRESCGTVEQHR